MGEEREVLRHNLSFYLAFVEGDVEAMDRVWAQDVPVTCSHPGWDVIRGRDQVLASWYAIFEAEGGPPVVQCEAAEAEVYGDTAVVTCRERIGSAILTATNVFVRERGEWRMVQHQAGQVVRALGSEDPGPGRGPMH